LYNYLISFVVLIFVASKSSKNSAIEKVDFNILPVSMGYLCSAPEIGFEMRWNFDRFVNATEHCRNMGKQLYLT